jgi:hypothetical protein
LITWLWPVVVVVEQMNPQTAVMPPAEEVVVDYY